ncbi:hypothetical protein Tco_1270807 [Tanacetum coccineum]
MNGYRISLGIVLSLSKVNYSTLLPGYHEYLLGIRPNEKDPSKVYIQHDSNNNPVEAEDAEHGCLKREADPLSQPQKNAVRVDKQEKAAILLHQSAPIKESV